MVVFVHRPACQCWALMGAWVKRTKLCLREKTDGRWTGCILLLASCGLQVPQDQQKPFNHSTIAHLCCSMQGVLFHWHISKAAAWTLIYCQRFWVSYEPPTLQLFLQEEFFSPLRNHLLQWTLFQHLPQSKDSVVHFANALFWAPYLFLFYSKINMTLAKQLFSPPPCHLCCQRRWKSKIK